MCDFINKNKVRCLCYLGLAAAAVTATWCFSAPTALAEYWVKPEEEFPKLPAASCAATDPSTVIGGVYTATACNAIIALDDNAACDLGGPKPGSCTYTAAGATQLDQRKKAVEELKKKLETYKLPVYGAAAVAGLAAAGVTDLTHHLISGEKVQDAGPACKTWQELGISPCYCGDPACYHGKCKNPKCDSPRVKHPYEDLKSHKKRFAPGQGKQEQSKPNPKQEQSKPNPKQEQSKPKPKQEQSKPKPTQDEKKSSGLGWWWLLIILGIVGIIGGLAYFFLMSGDEETADEELGFYRGRRDRGRRDRRRRDSRRRHRRIAIS